MNQDGGQSLVSGFYYRSGVSKLLRTVEMQIGISGMQSHQTCQKWSGMVRSRIVNIEGHLFYNLTALRRRNRHVFHHQNIVGYTLSGRCRVYRLLHYPLVHRAAVTGGGRGSQLTDAPVWPWREGPATPAAAGPPPAHQLAVSARPSTPCQIPAARLMRMAAPTRPLKVKCRPRLEIDGTAVLVTLDMHHLQYGWEAISYRHC